MAKLIFDNLILEKIFKRWKWTRKNTILLYDLAKDNNILNYSYLPKKADPYIFQPLLFQFQCIITTTDTYYRRLNKSKHRNFGILVKNNLILKKKDISDAIVRKELSGQLINMEKLLSSYSNMDTENNLLEILKISDHEYLHQGQMIIMIREAGYDFPLRFKRAWAL